MYYFYFNKLLLPVAPESLQLKINNANKTYTLINQGEINILKKPELTDVSFDLLLPNVKYPFAKYKGKFKRAEYYLKKFDKLKSKKKKFQFIVTRALPNGKVLFCTNMKVSLEEYTIKEDADNGFDIIVSMKLKQYRPFKTKKYKVTGTDKAQAMNTRENSDNAPSNKLPKTYKVKKGDCLWNIAKKYYDNGSKYTLIVTKNNIANPNVITVGQKLTIPVDPDAE